MCLRTTYFSNIYKQKEDATLNSPFSAVVASLLEELSLKTILTRPRWYVDDTFRILRKGSFAITKGVRLNIKVTVEQEKMGHSLT